MCYANGIKYRFTRIITNMPIKVPDNLPALEILAKEGVDLIAENIAQRQDIRPLRLLLLNRCPRKRYRNSICSPIW